MRSILLPYSLYPPDLKTAAGRSYCHKKFSESKAPAGGQEKKRERSDYFRRSPCLGKTFL